MTVLSAALLVTQIAGPAMAGVTWGYNRGQDLYGVNRSGNPSMSRGTSRGTNKVFRYHNGDNEFPDLVLMFARGSVRNDSRRTQRYTNLGTIISDQMFDFPAQTDIVTVLGFFFTSYGYNITVATWRNQGPQEPEGPLEQR